MNILIGLSNPKRTHVVISDGKNKETTQLYYVIIKKLINGNCAHVDGMLY